MKPPMPQPGRLGAPFDNPRPPWTKETREEAQWATIAAAELLARKEAHGLDAWSELYGKLDD